MQVTRLEITFALVLQHQRDTSEPTDAWTAEISTAGQRAMRIDGQEQWTMLASSSLQRSINQQQHRRKVPISGFFTKRPSRFRAQIPVACLG